MLLGTKQLISLKYYGKWEGCTKDDFLCVFWFARQALKHRWSDKDSKLLLSMLSLTSWQVTWTAAHPLKSIKHYRIQNVLEQVQYMSNQTVLFSFPPYLPFRSQDFWDWRKCRFTISFTLTKKVINYNVIAVMSKLGHMTSLSGIMTKVLQFSVEADQYFENPLRI